MKLSITTDRAAVTLEGSAIEVRSLLPDMLAALGLSDRIEIDPRDPFDVTDDFGELDEGDSRYASRIYPEDHHHTSSVSVKGYAALVRMKTGKSVETIWPECLNDPARRGCSSVVW